MNDQIIELVERYAQTRESEKYSGDRPLQRPFSRWAIDEIVWNLKTDDTNYADDIIRNFISLMRTYRDAAEVERKKLFETAIDTAEDLYSFLFDEKKGESI